MVLVVALGAAVLSPGCGRHDEESAAQETAAPQVDPHFVSAAALIEYFNTLTTTEPIDPTASNSLYYAENEFQRRLVSLGQTAAPIFDLGAAMQERFKAPVDPSSPKAFIAKANKPAHITQDQGERALAEYKDWDGTIERMQLVKYNQRWWISGYTLEYHPLLKDIKRDQLVLSEAGLKAMAAVAPAMATRVRAGEFRTADEARKAVQVACQEYAMQHPDQFREYAEYVRAHPEALAGLNRK